MEWIGWSEKKHLASLVHSINLSTAAFPFYLLFSHLLRHLLLLIRHALPVIRPFIIHSLPL